MMFMLPLTATMLFSVSTFGACVRVCMCALFSCCWLLNSKKKSFKKMFDSFGISLHLKPPFSRWNCQSYWNSNLWIYCAAVVANAAFIVHWIFKFFIWHTADSFTACSSVLVVPYHEQYCGLNFKLQSHVINTRWEQNHNVINKKCILRDIEAEKMASFDLSNEFNANIWMKSS